MSTEDMQGTNDGNRPEEVTQVPPAASPTEPEPMVVVEFVGRCFEQAFATCPMRVVLVWSDEDFDEEDHNVVVVDGKLVSVQDVSLETEDTIPADVARELKAAGIDVPDFTTESEATSG